MADLERLQTALVSAVTSVFSQIGGDNDGRQAGGSNRSTSSLTSSRSSTRSREPQTRAHVNQSTIFSSDDEDFEKESPRRLLPSAFVSRKRRKSSSRHSMKATKKQYYEYERDIVLLPMNFGGAGSDSILPIPCSKSNRLFLSENGLIGKIVLNSAMNQDEIFSEIRSVFSKQMQNNDNFKFSVLQHSGGGSKCLTLPTVSKNFVWSASAVAGKNSKTPIYILAEEELQLFKSTPASSNTADMGERDFDTNLGLQAIKPESDSIAENGSVCEKSQVSSYYDAYINLISSSNSESLKGATPPISPITPPEENPNCLSLSQIIENQRAFAFSGNKLDDVFRISVRRRHVFEDALQFIKCGVPPHSHLRVTFLNEPAVDAGGPCREFLQLFMHSIMSNSMFFQGLVDTKTRVKAELDQIIEGLRLYGVLDIIRLYPVTCRELFIAYHGDKQQLTASSMQDLFIARYSIEGSNMRTEEERVYMYWLSFLYSTEKAIEPMKIDEVTVRISLEDILQYVTGTKHIPPTGFVPQPSIGFSDTPMPKVDTCCLQLTLPLKVTSHEEFAYTFVSAMINSPGFGQV